MSALPPKADICSALGACPLSANSDQIIAPRRTQPRGAIRAVQSSVFSVSIELSCNGSDNSGPIRRSRAVIYIRMPTDEREHHDEADDIRDGDTPAMAKPEPNGLRFRIYICQRHTRGGTEPNHRASKSDRISEITPIVTTLLQGKRSEGDIVENSR